MPEESLKSMLGNRLRRVREWRGWKQEELAEAADFHPQTVNKWENGKGNLSADRLEELAAALDVEPVTLLPVAGSGYKQGLRDARHMVESAYVGLRHNIDLALEATPGEMKADAPEAAHRPATESEGGGVGPQGGESATSDE